MIYTDIPSIDLYVMPLM